MLGCTLFNLLSALQIQWLKQGGFGGAMVWSLDMDYFSGTFCGQGKYPLINTLKSGHTFLWVDLTSCFFQFLQALNIISAGHTSQKLSSVGTGTQNTSTVDGLSVLTFFPLPGNLIFCVGARTNLVFVNEFTASMTQLKPLLPILPIMCCSVWTLCSLLSPPQANSLAWIPWLVKRFDHCVWQWWCVCLSICPLFWWTFFVLCHVPCKVTC